MPIKPRLKPAVSRALKNVASGLSSEPTDRGRNQRSWATTHRLVGKARKSNPLKKSGALYWGTACAGSYVLHDRYASGRGGT